jgi:hypothetical protein
LTVVEATDIVARGGPSQFLEGQGARGGDRSSEFVDPDEHAGGVGDPVDAVRVMPEPLGFRHVNGECGVRHGILPNVGTVDFVALMLPGASSPTGLNPAQPVGPTIL